MVHTEVLTVAVEQGFDDLQIAIHPNDGLDLDLITREHAIDIYTGTSIEKFKDGKGMIGQGELQLLNECPLGVLQVSNSMYQKMACPEKVLVILDQDKVMLAYRI